MTLSYNWLPTPTQTQDFRVPTSPIYLPETGCPIYAQYPLAKLTSFKVGGPAQWCMNPKRIEDLQAGLAWAYAEGLPVTRLGAGSNLLVSDRGLSGLVICTRHFRHTHFDEESCQLTVAAGEYLPRLAWQAAERGWSGLEWAVGIPGTVGGAVVMNAGAHRSSIADLLVKVEVLSPKGELEILTPEDLKYSYRTSMLQNDPRFVVRATFQLQPGFNRADVRKLTREQMQKRRTTQPYHRPSCGSVFRNPSPHAAGWLIEQTGLKGHTIGGAQIAERHANFILNCGGATASDIFRLIRHAQEQVDRHWQLWLEPEVRMLGEFQHV
ncbi:MAG: UDP-N-acetylmuramate dehydrogenase [Cyanobacteriota bacterium]|nr:UDP-N-acetylmuramate dehydrogenase [Cyanobacteriota bacterium]